MPAGAVRVTFPPGQNVVEPLAVTVGTGGGGLTVTGVPGEVAGQLLLSVVVTA